MYLDKDVYDEYKDRVMELAQETTKVRDGEYVAELRSAEEIAAEIPELSVAEVREIRTIAEIDDTSIDLFRTGDDALE